MKPLGDGLPLGHTLQVQVVGTSLVLNKALLRIQEEYGLDYSEDCSRLLQVIDQQLVVDGRNKHRLNTEELPSLIRQLKEALHQPAIQEEVEQLAIGDPETRLETLAGHALEVNEAEWVSGWKERVLRCFRNYRHLVTYAHKKLTGHLGLRLDEPSVVVAAPMPFGWNAAFYDDSKDIIVFLTTGVRPRPELFSDKDSDEDLYGGYGWPPKYANMAFVARHEVAHRCLMHLMGREKFEKVFSTDQRMKSLEEELCDALALRVMISRTRFDRRLKMADFRRRFSLES